MAVGVATEPRSERAVEPRRPRIWGPVIATAVITALLTSVATAAFTRAENTGQVVNINQTQDPGQVDEAPVAGSATQPVNWQSVIGAVADSVVSIQANTPQGASVGSGMILDSSGRVLTNNHVVQGAENDQVQVTMRDGRLLGGRIIGTDADTDLAVVQLDDPPADIQPVALGDSNQVRVGDPVLAVGNPLGLANTATAGIVSAIDRPVTAGERDNFSVTNAIQLDAAINPGNSGGPLFDTGGRVIGVTSSIASLPALGGQAGSIGLGFAIPVNLAKTISQQLIDTGSAQHAFLGVTMEDSSATVDGVSRRGAVVMRVVPGSPAAQAGIQVGDVIVAFNDQPVLSLAAVMASVRQRQAGDQVALTLVRDGVARQVPITLAVRDEAALAQPEEPVEPVTPAEPAPEQPADPQPAEPAEPAQPEEG